MSRVTWKYLAMPGLTGKIYLQLGVDSLGQTERGEWRTISMTIGVRGSIEKLQCSGGVSREWTPCSIFVYKIKLCRIARENGRGCEMGMIAFEARTIVTSGHKQAHSSNCKGGVTMTVSESSRTFIR